MQRTNFADMPCSIARTLNVVGEPWSPLIIRNIWKGITRFEKIQQDLGISRKVLTQRLKWLVEQGVLEQRPYSQRPTRYEYVLTRKGLEFCDVLLAITAWGDRWTAGQEGPPVLVRHQGCGQVTRTEPHCAHCQEPLHADGVDMESTQR